MFYLRYWCSHGWAFVLVSQRFLERNVGKQELGTSCADFYHRARNSTELWKVRLFLAERATCTQPNMYEAIWNDHSPVSRWFCFPEVAFATSSNFALAFSANQTQGLCSFLLGDTTLLLHEENWSSSPSSAGLRVELGETGAQYVWGAYNWPIVRL